MSTKRYEPGQIGNPRRKIEVEIANGKMTPEAAGANQSVWAPISRAAHKQHTRRVATCNL
ncbi:MAG: hypothetical protein ABSF45_15535 [Terriglobia bacterium]|jgi:hypothetical protein